MGIIFGASLPAFLFALIFTPLCRTFSRRHGLMDHPDHRRKLHLHPVSRIGGIAVFLAVAASLGTLAYWPYASGVPAPIWSDVAKLMPAISLALLTGLLDDICNLRPWQKLGGQALAAMVACSAGIQIRALAGHDISAPWVRLPLTIFWLIGCANAFNLIDGVDGLATGVGLLATLATMMAALLGGNPSLVLATAPLAGALLGFLCYNFNPATIFLGDCGSLSIGFALGGYGILWSQKSATLLGFTAPLIALAIPLADTALAIARRFLRGKPIFSADRRHIHHRLLDLGFPPRTVALLMYGVAATAAACAVSIGLVGVRGGAIVILLFLLTIWMGLRQLGYGEFAAIRRVLFGGLVAKLVDTQVSLHQLDAQLAATISMEQRRTLLATASRQLGFHEVRIVTEDSCWRQALGPALHSECWQLRVPLESGEYVEFSIALTDRLHPVMLGAFANVVRQRMRPALSSTSHGRTPLRNPAFTALARRNDAFLVGHPLGRALPRRQAGAQLPKLI